MKKVLYIIETVSRQFSNDMSLYENCVGPFKNNSFLKLSTEGGTKYSLLDLKFPLGEEIRLFSFRISSIQSVLLLVGTREVFN